MCFRTRDKGLRLELSVCIRGQEPPRGHLCSWLGSDSLGSRASAPVLVTQDFWSQLQMPGCIISPRNSAIYESCPESLRPCHRRNRGMHGWIISQTDSVCIKSPILILNEGHGHLAPRREPGKPAAPSRAMRPWVFSVPLSSIVLICNRRAWNRSRLCVSQHQEVGSVGLGGGVRLSHYLQESQLCEPCFLCGDF